MNFFTRFVAFESQKNQRNRLRQSRLSRFQILDAIFTVLLETQICAPHSSKTNACVGHSCSCVFSVTFLVNVTTFLWEKWLNWRSGMTWLAVSCRHNECSGPRSLDLTPCDFFLRGYLKSLVYRQKPRDLEDLKQKITDSCAEIDQQIIDRSLVEFRIRLEKCIESDGGHIEHLRWPISLIYFQKKLPKCWLSNATNRVKKFAS